MADLVTAFLVLWQCAGPGPLTKCEPCFIDDCVLERDAWETLTECETSSQFCAAQPAFDEATGMAPGVNPKPPGYKTIETKGAKSTTELPIPQMDGGSTAPPLEQPEKTLFHESDPVVTLTEPLHTKTLVDGRPVSHEEPHDTFTLDELVKITEIINLPNDDEERKRHEEEEDTELPKIDEGSKGHEDEKAFEVSKELPKIEGEVYMSNSEKRISDADAVMRKVYSTLPSVLRSEDFQPSKLTVEETVLAPDNTIAAHVVAKTIKRLPIVPVPIRTRIVEPVGLKRITNRFQGRAPGHTPMIPTGSAHSRRRRPQRIDDETPSVTNEADIENLTEPSSNDESNSFSVRHKWVTGEGMEGRAIKTSFKVPEGETVRASDLMMKTENVNSVSVDTENAAVSKEVIAIESSAEIPEPDNAHRVLSASELMKQKPIVTLTDPLHTRPVIDDTTARPKATTFASDESSEAELKTTETQVPQREVTERTDIIEKTGDDVQAFPEIRREPPVQKEIAEKTEITEKTEDDRKTPPEISGILLRVNDVRKSIQSVLQREIAPNGIEGTRLVQQVDDKLRSLDDIIASLSPVASPVHFSIPNGDGNHEDLQNEEPISHSKHRTSESSRGVVTRTPHGERRPNQSRSATAAPTVHTGLDETDRATTTTEEQTESEITPTKTTEYEPTPTKTTEYEPTPTKTKEYEPTPTKTKEYEPTPTMQSTDYEVTSTTTEYEETTTQAKTTQSSRSHRTTESSNLGIMKVRTEKLPKNELIRREESTDPYKVDRVKSWLEALNELEGRPGIRLPSKIVDVNGKRRWGERHVAEIKQKSNVRRKPESRKINAEMRFLNAMNERPQSSSEVYREMSACSLNQTLVINECRRICECEDLRTRGSCALRCFHSPTCVCRQGYVYDRRVSREWADQCIRLSDCSALHETVVDYVDVFHVPERFVKHPIAPVDFHAAPTWAPPQARNMRPLAQYGLSDDGMDRSERYQCGREPLRLACENGRRAQLTVRWHVYNGQCVPYTYGYCSGELTRLEKVIRSQADCNRLCLT